MVSPLFRKALPMAVEAHAGQQWGGKPYMEHVNRVVGILHASMVAARNDLEGQAWIDEAVAMVGGSEPVQLRVPLVGFGWPAELDEWFAAAVLHDAVEDCADFTLGRVGAQIGPGAARLVGAVTTFGTRRQRAKKLLEQLEQVPEAIPIKLADRLVNVDQCWRERHGLLFAYRREWRELRPVCERGLAGFGDHMPSFQKWWVDGGCVLLHELDRLLDWSPHRGR